MEFDPTRSAPSFFLDAISAKGEAAFVMRGFAIALTPCLLLLGLACAPEPEGPNAFMTQGSYATTQNADATTGDSMDTNAPEDLPSSGDGDGDPTSTTNTTNTTDPGDGDGAPGDGDGDPDPTTGGPAVCGNGVIDDGEQCDGGNLGGFTCIDLGYSGGTLGCDPVTCTYDASACVADTSTSGTSG